VLRRTKIKYETAAAAAAARGFALLRYAELSRFSAGEIVHCVNEDGVVVGAIFMLQRLMGSTNGR